MKPSTPALLSLLAIASLSSPTRAQEMNADATLTAEQTDFFERKIRPPSSSNATNATPPRAKKLKGGPPARHAGGRAYAGATTAPPWSPDQPDESLLLIAALK